jgi:asparagine synthase (glutamine-hydrolysing)
VRFPRPVQRKQLLRDAGLLGLDPQLFERPAHGFEMPLELWCQQALRDEVRELFEDTALVASVGLHPPAVSRLLAAFESRAPGLYWSRLWAIFVFLWWCREHRMAA